uniref:Aminoacyl-tRNA hydrolase n=1 Tax=Schlesneria paludicola TaxID=360056 RepID=A0A7C4QPB8_9PLAN
MPARTSADVVVDSRVVIPAEEFAWSFVRSSGPGGQNVNKVSSKAVLRWKPRASSSLPEAIRERFLTRYASRLTGDGELILTSDESRDQAQNAARCRDKLRELVRSVVAAPRPRRPTRPTKGAQQRRRAAKQHQSRKKQLRGRIPREE